MQKMRRAQLELGGKSALLVLDDFDPVKAADIAVQGMFTHGGQICLPGGTPIMTNVKTQRRYARGLWQHGRMTGYTTTGVGVSVMPVRFFSKGEIAVITLRRK